MKTALKNRAQSLVKSCPIGDLNELILTVKEFATKKFLDEEQKEAAKFSVGDEVIFEAADERLSGTIVEMQYGVARILTDDQRRFKVHYSRLEKQKVLKKL